MPVVKSGGVGSVDVEHLCRVEAVTHRCPEASFAHLVQPVEVLSGEGKPQISTVGLVENNGGELGVVRPGPATEVVRAGAGPGVVDDADLGMHVDGDTRVVLQPVRGNSLGSNLDQRFDRAPTTEQLGHTVETVEVGLQRDDEDQAEPGPRL
jgi:hypothetical protein